MEDDGAPITDWPEYEVPAGALSEGATRSESPAAPVATPPAATPPAPVVPPAAAPAAAPPAAVAGTTPTQATEPGESVPIYRLNEVIERERATKAENARLLAEVTRLRTAPPAPVAPPPAAIPAAVVPEDPTNVALRTRLEEVIPGLKRLGELVKLADRTGDLDSVREATEAHRRATETFFDQHTNTQLANLHGRAATLLGEGKTAADLPEMTRQTLTSAFARWVSDDPERTARYERLDTKLEEEFWTVYRAAVFDPVRRTQSVAAIAAGARPALPVGGTSTSPVAPAPPTRPAASDEDAIHARSWDQFQAAGRG